jgi:hypothetical protein
LAFTARAVKLPRSSNCLFKTERLAVTPVARPHYPSPPDASTAAAAGLYLNAKSFAMLAGISVRMAQTALGNAVAGETWYGQSLNVRVREGVLGRGGKAYEVFAPSLPSDLYDKWIAQQAKRPMPQAPSVTLPAPVITYDPTARKRTEKALWIYSIIEPVVGLRRYTPERSAAIAEVLSREYTRPDGKKVRVSRGHLYEWLKRYENGLLEGIRPRQRKDIGQRRVLITRQWDKACPLGEGKKHAIAEALAEYVRSLWASGAAGWNVIQRFASLKLENFSQEAGWDAPAAELKAACIVARSFIEQQRKSGLLAIADKDAKRFFDLHIPRIRRSRTDLKPMDVVVGDVHPIDISIHRLDGSIAYPRAICWHDVATNRLYATLVLLEKGEGIKQVHVAASFAAMCEAWGLPLSLYLDNGSEYSWHEMMAAFSEISRMAQALQRKFTVGNLPASGEVRELVGERRQVIRAMPYNAPAKPIEGLFSVIENTVLSMLSGWTGGDRMRAKTHNVGRAPLPYSGTWEQFHADFETALAFYHSAQQGGTMDGLSPADALRSHIEAGWTRTHVEEQVLLLAFAEEDTREADRGYVKWNGVEYYDDALLPLTGKTVIVRVSRHDPRYAFVFDETRKLICTAGVAPVFGFLDPAGAKEQGRRKKVLMRHVAELRENCSRLDLVEEMRRVVQADGPMPQAQIGATVEISEQAMQMRDALRAKEEAALAALPNHATALPQEARRLSQWSSADEIDPLLVDVFADEEGAETAPGRTEFAIETKES